MARNNDKSHRSKGTICSNVAVSQGIQQYYHDDCFEVIYYVLGINYMIGFVGILRVVPIVQIV